MSKQTKIAIGVLSVLLIAAIVWVVWLVSNDGGDGATPDPTPTVTQTVENTTTPTGEPTSEPTGEPEPTPTETGTEPASPEPTDVPEPEEQTFLGEGLATFENFTVELLPYDEDSAPERIEGKERFEVEVCVVQGLDGDDGLTRITNDPWYIESPSGETQRAIDDGVYDPVFPPDGDYAVGECASGWLTFDEFDESPLDYMSLVYENGLGDRAIWNFH